MTEGNHREKYGGFCKHFYRLKSFRRMVSAVTLCRCYSNACDKAKLIIFLRLALSLNQIARASCGLSSVHFKMLMLLYLTGKMLECF